jgi:hypothetical protein
MIGNSWVQHIIAEKCWLVVCWYQLKLHIVQDNLFIVMDLTFDKRRMFGSCYDKLVNTIQGDGLPFSRMPGPTSWPLIGTLHLYHWTHQYSFSRLHWNGWAKFKGRQSLRHEFIFRIQCYLLVAISHILYVSWCPKKPFLKWPLHCTNTIHKLFEANYVKWIWNLISCCQNISPWHFLQKLWTVGYPLKGHSYENVCEIITLNDRLDPN